MKIIVFLIFAIITVSVGYFIQSGFIKTISGAPPYQVADNPPNSDELDNYAHLKNWKRPVGPARVGLQVGHLNSNEVPDELKNLRSNTGASGGGKTESEVNLAIAELTAGVLRNSGAVVDILPATVPPEYIADVFVAIHADGSEYSYKTGYKAAVPRRDLSGKATKLLAFVEEEYQLSTGLEKDPNVTRNMRGYYAFGWWRYKHSVHPMTTSIILETGFLTNPHDRTIIVDQSELSAQGLSSGILAFLKSEKLL